MDCATIQELIFNLRSSFFSNEFQNVAKELVEREAHLKEELTELKRNNEAVDKEKRLLFLENLKLKDEIDRLRKQQKNFEKRESDFADRISKLEKTAKELMSSEGTSWIGLKKKQQKNSAAEISRPPLAGKKTDSKKRTEPEFQEIIQIDDDDDDSDNDVIATYKRRRVSKEIKKESIGDYVDHNQTESQPIASHPVSTPHSVDNSDSCSGSDVEKIDDAYKSIIAKMKMRKRWEFEGDMIEDFNKDDELCMSAVCALQRQRLTSSGANIVSVFHISRIKQLAELLTDGDPLQKVTKKASELNGTDLEDCQRFARSYSIQLFNIYQKKDDPFFPTSRS